MSAWPEAVYIIRQIQNALNLNQRVLRLQNRLFVFAPAAAGQTFQPDLNEEYDFSDDSIWFIEKADDANKVYAISVYSEAQGWSSAIYLSPDTSQIDFTPASATGVFANVDNVEDALNALAAALGSVSINDATKSSKGIVRIGDNINVSNGIISVSNANSSTKGVMRLYNTIGTNTDGTMTQSAIKAAIGQSALTSENAIVTNWSNSATGTISGSNYNYYVAEVNLTNSYGEHPTISVVATSPYEVPTEAEIEAFNRINFITVEGSQITLFAKIKPSIDFTINVKV